MRFPTVLGGILFACSAYAGIAQPRQASSAADAAGATLSSQENTCNVSGKIAPKVFIVSMFKPEAEIWFQAAKDPRGIGNLRAKNITVVGSSLVYPGVRCLESCAVCQITTQEAEINAASTITALLLSPHFNLTNTYFLIAGIAGVNPRMGTINDVTFSRFTVQVALQYEFDAREIPGNFSTGYVPQGAQAPNQYPKTLYGTEVFEVNDNLRQYVYNITKNIKPKDTPIAANYRQNYKAPEPNIYKEAARSPKILKCDIACSDVYFSGTLLSEAFDNTTRLLTNGSGIPCMTAQEDNATLEPMIRFAQHKLIDFSRIIILRSAADFDRPYPGLSNIANLFYVNQGSFISSIENLYIVGMPVVKTILNQWKTVFEKGIKPTNYIGDIFGTLGGMPDFGPGEGFVQSNPVSAYEPVDLPTKKRDEESERSFEELYGGMTRADFYRKKRAFVG